MPLTFFNNVIAIIKYFNYKYNSEIIVIYKLIGEERVYYGQYFTVNIFQII